MSNSFLFWVGCKTAFKSAPPFVINWWNKTVTDKGDSPVCSRCALCALVHKLCLSWQNRVWPRCRNLLSRNGAWKVNSTHLNTYICQSLHFYSAIILCSILYIVHDQCTQYSELGGINNIRLICCALSNQIFESYCSTLKSTFIFYRNEKNIHIMDEP